MQGSLFCGDLCISVTPPCIVILYPPRTFFLTNSLFIHHIGSLPLLTMLSLNAGKKNRIHSASQEKMEGLVKIFVYGTLKRGFANHYLLENNFDGAASFITKGHTKEAFPLVVGTDAYIPFMLPLKGQGKVVIGFCPYI